MAVVITTETNVAIPANTNVEVVNTLVGRKSAVIQVQTAGVVWIKFTGAASVNDGFAVNGGNLVVVNASFTAPSGADFYEGPINIFWQPKGVDPDTNQVPTSTVCRVIETS